jgi:hypothetical protein
MMAIATMISLCGNAQENAYLTVVPVQVQSATSITIPMSPTITQFANTVQAHFAQARACWKQKQLPKATTIRKTINGCLNHCQRFWPNEPDKPYKFFAAIVTESGGNNIGNPADPSYGICHVSYLAAHHACHVFNIPHPSTKTAFIKKLSEDVDFNILCSAAAMKECEAWTDNDWVRTILIYKCGLSGFSKALDKLGDKPVTEMKIWRHYYAVYLWIACLKERIITEGTMLTDCGCLPPEDRVREEIGQDKLVNTDIFPAQLSAIRNQ